MDGNLVVSLGTIVVVLAHWIWHAYLHDGLCGQLDGLCGHLDELALQFVPSKLLQDAHTALADEQVKHGETAQYLAAAVAKADRLEDEMHKLKPSVRRRKGKK